jgi:hypothetical protein
MYHTKSMVADVIQEKKKSIVRLIEKQNFVFQNPTIRVVFIFFDIIADDFHDSGSSDPKRTGLVIQSLLFYARL